MTDRIRINRHTSIPDTGSFEVRIPGKDSVYFYWDDHKSRRLRPDAMDQETAKKAAQDLAREEQEKMK